MFFICERNVLSCEETTHKKGRTFNCIFLYFYGKSFEISGVSQWDQDTVTKLVLNTICGEEIGKNVELAPVYNEQQV